ncbi:hypothetical protein V9T40_014327 [Parthenolecanium corni]|uniref:RING-type domain-containing protein n=1 Tax=Parthenolecanium corni TaxID=536013 RepID=A0AAN9T6P6_9HEMI
MMEDRKLLLKDVNDFFICKICRGYLIDATALLECTHTFCRSCIVQRLQKKQKCPICEVQVNKTPVLSLRPDTIMQRLVYKIVPGLYKSELLRRKKLLNETSDMVVSDDESGSQEYYFDPEEPISISLEYIEYVGKKVVAVVLDPKCTRAQCNVSRSSVMPYLLRET